MQRPQTLLAATFDLIADANLEGVASVIANNPDFIDQPTFFAGGTLLHYAAARSTPEMVALLIGCGFTVNARGKYYGGTPLDSACSAGRTENARVLLASGASLDAASSTADPLFGAVVSGSLETVTLLIEAGAELGRRHTLESGQSVNAAEFARMKGHAAIEALLRTAAESA